MRGLAVLILGVAVSAAIYLDTAKLGHTPRPSSDGLAGSGFNVPGGNIFDPVHTRAVWQLPIAVLLVFAGVAVALALWQSYDEEVRYPFP